MPQLSFGQRSHAHHRPRPRRPGERQLGPAWEDHDTPFRRWLYGKLTAAGFEYAADAAGLYAPANRYDGINKINTGIIATLTGASLDAVRAAHKADLNDWAREEQLRDHPDLAVLDADLDRIQHRSSSPIRNGPAEPAGCHHPPQVARKGAAEGKNGVMTLCKKCGARKRSWLRSCSRCRSKPGRTDAAADAADIAVAGGLLSWIWRGAMAAVRAVLRTLS